MQPCLRCQLMQPCFRCQLMQPCLRCQLMQPCLRCQLMQPCLRCQLLQPVLCCQHIRDCCAASIYVTVGMRWVLTAGSSTCVFLAAAWVWRQSPFRCSSTLSQANPFQGPQTT
eukprot:jgi/Mesvir1/6827/Mv26507-RA.1